MDIKIHRRFYHVYYLVLVTAVYSCANNEKTPDRASTVKYADYKVWAEEGAADVSCLVQFKRSQQAMPQKLSSGCSILLDGVELKADSARYSGVYYEARQPLAAFYGEHTLTYQDGKKESKELFVFQPFTMPVNWPATISRQNFRFTVSGFTDERTSLFLSLTDTAFMNKDFNERVEAVKGEVKLPPGLLAGLKNGPVHLQISREEVRGLKGGLRGTLTLGYSAERDFLLVD